MNRPQQISGRKAPNRNAKYRQPQGYYQQVIPMIHLHSAAKKRLAAYELAFSQ